MDRDAFDRFRDKVCFDTTSGCWLWLGAKDRGGYGRFLYDGKNRHAHRVIWILIFGSDPYDAVIMHDCDNRACVNPSHLRLGTQADNIQDRVHKKRCFKPNGQLNSQAKLTEQQVRAIREEFANTGCSKAFLARKYNMSNSAVGRIVNNETWISS